MLPNPVRVERRWTRSLRIKASRPQVIPNMFLTRSREATKHVVKEAIALRLRGFARVHHALEYKRFAANQETQVIQS
jgi:hypothetical protein